MRPRDAPITDSRESRIAAKAFAVEWAMTTAAAFVGVLAVVVVRPATPQLQKAG